MAYKSAPNLVAITKNGIDGKTTGATVIGTTDPKMRFVPLYVSAEPTGVSGLVTVSSLSVGTNSATFNNILVATALTGAITANFLVNTPITALSPSVVPGTSISVNITVGAVGTTYNLRVSVIGFYY